MDEYASLSKIEFELCGGNLPEKYKAFVRRVLNDRNLIPAADVAPVVHGRWEHGYYCYEPATQCSVCKVCLAKGHRAEKQFTYCPKCGAKMDGGTT